MSATATADPIDVARGELIRRARRAAGLTQADLADRIGVPLYVVDRLEHGTMQPDGHLPLIAAATELPVSAFQPRLSPTATAAAVEPDKPLAEEGLPAPGRLIIAGTFVVLIVVRFLTEKVGVLPDQVTFVDVPILGGVLLAMGIFRSPSRADEQHARGYMAVGLVFFVWAVISAVANIERVAPGPVLIFIYGFLGPLFFYAATYHLWPAGNARWLGKALIGLVLVQFAIGFIFDLPAFLATENPDEISGTFGENGYQLTLFLLTMIAYVAGVAVFDPRTAIARFAPGLIAGMALLVFLAQFRAILPAVVITLAVVAVVISAGRLRGAVVAVGLTLILIFSLQFVANQFTILKYQSGAAELQSDPAVFVKARLGTVEDVISHYDDNPVFVATGSGPGTFSSRAWRTFADLKRTRTAVAAGFAEFIQGGTYLSDVAEKYTMPRYRNAVVIDGSRAISFPWSSYTALAAEVGIPGLALLLGAYLMALAQALRLALVTSRRRLRDDPVAPILIAALAGFLILLQASIFENWLEVTRVTFFTWGLLAIATKELHNRSDAEIR